jgi:hypothetical protein
MAGNHTKIDLAIMAMLMSLNERFVQIWQIFFQVLFEVWQEFTTKYSISVFEK